MKNSYSIVSNKVFIEIPHKNNNPFICVIDKHNLRLVKSVPGTWGVRYNQKTKSYYAQTQIRLNGKRIRVNMHRLIAKTPEGMDTDHLNHDTLNNTEDNLKVTTRVENSQNTRKKKNNTSGFIGVCYHKHTGKWRAYVMLNRKQIHGGLFKTPEEAYQRHLELKQQYHSYYNENKEIIDQVI